MDLNNLERLYLELHSENESTLNCGVQSLITIFLAAYCDSSSILITLVRRETSAKHISLQSNALNRYSVLRSSYENIPEVVQQCTLPAILSADGNLVRSGLCGVLRHIIHLADRKESKLLHRKLLVCFWDTFSHKYV